LIDGETGFLAESGDVDQFRDRLCALLDDPLLRRRMGDAGRTRYQANFTLEQMLQKTLAVYQMAALDLAAPGVRDTLFPKARVDY